MEEIHAQSFGKKLDDSCKNLLMQGSAIAWLCYSAQRKTHAHKILNVASISAAGPLTRLISWSQISPYSHCGKGRGSFWVQQNCSLPRVGKGQLCNSLHRELRERRSRELRPLKTHEVSASRMQWPELEFCQDSGINFPSASQNGPRHFYFYSFSITTAQQRKQAPKQYEPPRVIFPCGVPSPHHTSCWPYLTEV